MENLGRRGATRARILGVIACIAAFCLSAAAAHGAPSLIRGFTDDVWFTTSNPLYWVHQTAATGAKRVLLEVDWESIEPNKPKPHSNPTDPQNPAYGFSYLDARVRLFAGSGLSVAMLVTNAPRWAEHPGGSPTLEATGGYRPDPVAFGQMAQALARRYSGSFPDPLHPGRNLPRVQYFQAWAEANLSAHLSPQWIRSQGQLVEAGPAIYRQMLNHFYAGIKAGDSHAQVISTGLGPYGDVASTSDSARMPPAEFLRGLLCLQGRNLQPASCPDPAHYDILAMDPYAVLGPTVHAYNPDDVSAPDLGKLTRIQRKALSTGRLLPHARKQLWVTEFSYDSKPGNPYGVSLATQARWLEQALYVFWNQGVNTAIWYLVRDQLPTFNPNNYYSGVYRYSGAPKPSFTAYRFPFVVMPSSGRGRAWGISPARGSVAVQHRQGRRWVTLFHVRVSAGGVFVHKVSARLHGNFRAKVGKQTSLVWHR
jgi:hypothetical protein